QGNQQVLTGHPVSELKLKPDHPDLMSIAHWQRADPSRALPAYVALQQIPYIGPAYLGSAHQAFDVTGDPGLPGFAVPNLALASPTAVEQLNRQLRLRRRLEALARAGDRLSQQGALDRFQEQAWSMLTRPEVVRAFDIGREDPRLRDHYGR